MGRFSRSRFKTQQEDEEHALAALRGDQELGDVSPPQAPGPYDHLSNEQLSDPDFVAALLGDQEGGDTRAPKRPYKVDIGEAQVYPFKPNQTQLSPATITARPEQEQDQDPLEQFGIDEAPKALSRAQADAITDRQKAAFQNNPQGGWDSSQYGPQDSLGAITGKGRAGPKVSDHVAQNPDPVQGMEPIPNAMPGDLEGQAQQAPQAPQAPRMHPMLRGQAPQEPQVSQAPQDPSQAYAQTTGNGQAGLYGSPMEAEVARQQRELADNKRRAGDEWDRLHPNGEDDPLLSHGYRQTDDDIQRMWLMNGMAGGLDAARQAAAFGHQLQQAYDKRSEDTPVFDRASAEMLADHVGWKAAANATGRSPSVKWLPSAANSSASRQNMLADKLAVAREAELGRYDRSRVQSQDKGAQRESTQYITEQNNDTRLRVNKANNDARAHASGSPGGTDGVVDRIGFAKIGLQEISGGMIDPGAAEEIARTGDTSALPPGLRAKADSVIFSAAQLSDKKIHEAMKDATVSNMRTPDVVERGALDPKFVHKEQSKFNDLDIPFRQADSAIARLAAGDGKKLALISNYGTDTLSQVAKKLSASSDDLADAGSVFKFAADYAHGLYGANFTAQERATMQEGTGIRMGGSLAPLKDPKVLLRFMDNFAEVMRARKKLVPSGQMR